MGVAYATLSVILALSFELARLHRVFDYWNFFKLLLGRWRFKATSGHRRI